MSAGKPKFRPAPQVSRKGRWSHAEIERVKRMYGSYPEALIAKRLKRPLASVRRILMKIYDQSDRRAGPWTPLDIQELKSLLGKATTQVIVRKLRREAKDVEHRIALLRGQIKARPWSSDDEQQLKQLYGSRTDSDLAVILGRPQSQIAEKARQLCLAKDKSFQHRVQGIGNVRMPRWDPAQLDLLRQLYPNTPNVEIARLVRRTTKGIVSKAHDLGLKKSSDRLRTMGQENVSLRHGKPPTEPRDSGAGSAD
jgi:hypothetical protein